MNTTIHTEPAPTLYCNCFKINMNLLPSMLLQANELGVRLEIVNGLPIWE